MVFGQSPVQSLTTASVESHSRRLSFFADRETHAHPKTTSTFFWEILFVVNTKARQPIECSRFSLGFLALLHHWNLICIAFDDDQSSEHIRRLLVWLNSKDTSACRSVNTIHNGKYFSNLNLILNSNYIKESATTETRNNLTAVDRKKIIKSQRSSLWIESCS